MRRRFELWKRCKKLLVYLFGRRINFANISMRSQKKQKRRRNTSYLYVRITSLPNLHFHACMLSITGGLQWKNGSSGFHKSRVDCVTGASCLILLGVLLALLLSYILYLSTCAYRRLRVLLGYERAFLNVPELLKNLPVAVDVRAGSYINHRFPHLDAWIATTRAWSTAPATAADLAALPDIDEFVDPARDKQRKTRMDIDACQEMTMGFL